MLPFNNKIMDENTFTNDEVLGETRRDFLKKVSTVGVATAAFTFFDGSEVLAEVPEYVSNVPADALSVKLNINGVVKELPIDSRTTLLDALRERLDLTGSKKGCDHGQCGACTVIVDGRRVLSCLTLAAMCEDKKITTIEGIANGETLHPIQQAFLDYDALQCGYCTPGQICSAVALMQEAKNGEASFVTENLPVKAASMKLSDDEIRERMSGNICRCGAYSNIVAAIRSVGSSSKQ
jgi:xanthine dehydrogenase YagT iron-sulfur-binding subunit